MGKQKYKRNHWVPQAYLKVFAADADRAKIWTLGKTSVSPVMKPISKVAVKFYLYAPRKEGSGDYSFEQKLAYLEQLFGLAGWSQISTGFVDLNDTAIRKAIALLAAVMLLRNPTTLDINTELYRNFRSFFLDNGGPPDAVEINGREYRLDPASWPAYRDADEEDIKRMWLNSVGQAAWLAKLFMKMRWTIVTSDDPVFITSDNPVAIIHPELRFRGLTNAETSVMFPLSPTRLLHMDNRHSEPDAQYNALVGNGGAQNGLIWRNAIDQMFAHHDPLEVCAGMLAKVQAP